MKTTNYLWIAPLVGLLTLAGCKTAPTSTPPATGGAAAAPPPAQASTGTGLVTLVKNAPSLVGVGDQFTYELIATAQHEAADVMVVQTMPAGASYVSSDPEPAREGNKLTWALGTMSQGESKTIRLTVKADKEGDLVNCATVTAVPSVCITTTVGTPQLAIRKSGPAVAQLGQDVTYTVVVENSGKIAARDVVVTDTLPDELTSGDQKQLTFQVGELAPGSSKTISVPVKASKRGKCVNGVVAVSSNAGKVSAEFATTIAKPEVNIQLTTQDRELFINRPATYNIEASNPGDTRLTGLVITGTAAPETVIATAEGATVSGTTAIWKFDELGVGEKKNYAMKVVSKVPGTFATSARIATAEGLQDAAQDCTTTWRGVTGVTLEVTDDPDPIQVGETSKFSIKVTNQGSVLNISELSIVATLPAELEVVPGTVSDGGAVDGKTITWPVVPTVGPKGSVPRSYVAKGVKAGDGRTKVSITTATRKNPIEQIESTTVY